MVGRTSQENYVCTLELSLGAEWLLKIHSPWLGAVQTLGASWRCSHESVQTVSSPPLPPAGRPPWPCSPPSHTPHHSAHSQYLHGSKWHVKNFNLGGLSKAHPQSMAIKSWSEYPSSICSKTTKRRIRRNVLDGVWHYFKDFGSGPTPFSHQSKKINDIGPMSLGRILFTMWIMQMTEPLSLLALKTIDE